MTFQDLIKLTRRRLGTIAICAVLGLAGAIGLLAVTPASYTAASTAYVRVSVPESDGTAANANAYYSASQLATQKVKAFVPVFTSQAVAQAVIDQLKLPDTAPELAARLTASNATNSLTIAVTATAPSAEEARQISDAVVNQAAAQVKTLEGEGSPVEVVMMSPANLSEVAVAPSAAKYAVAGLLAGLLLGYLIAFARERFDTRLRTSEDVTERFDIPILGVIPNSPTIARTEDETGDFRAEESLRKLRTNLRYSNVDHEARIVVVTSPMPGDGKSSVAAHLARVMALAGQDVVLVDADLRRPVARDTFGITMKLGLTQVLVGAAVLDQAMQPTHVEGLSVLTAGITPPNPSELLGSQRMTELMRFLSGKRIVIIDAPPVLPVTDAAVLSKFADAVIMVTSSGKTTVEELDHALDAISRAGGTIAGVVLNRAPSSRMSKLRYGDSEYGYGYAQSEYSYDSPHHREAESRPGAPVVEPPQSEPQTPMSVPMPAVASAPADDSAIAALTSMSAPPPAPAKTADRVSIMPRSVEPRPSVADARIVAASPGTSDADPAPFAAAVGSEPVVPRSHTKVRFPPLHASSDSAED